MNINSTTAPAAPMPFTTTDLSRIMTLTLPELGMDRMTVPQVEETLSCSALTAHF
ncbi:hypothetical protein GCM10007079_25340 [Nocardiopsis terrae]|uniref:Uncharacterized protein n=1 Tax=Nocardiopsis terrae TaxID=372655 RepID=A0ABR9HFR0_9ACTN|nr:hypothetical protein [Nocardiopsis terrae]MBE1457861.1 hypothetical protein [Nocardiopsis terrae]GHC83867.1 hypothetical protein GCM10007079_25340 [Nocardiopsis terrae]